MNSFKIQQIWAFSYEDFSSAGHHQSGVQRKASHAILNCKSGRLDFNLSQCPDCGYIEIHNNSCRNRNCPNCQAVQKEIWVDKRRTEVIDAPYDHVVFTLPHELNPLIYCSQSFCMIFCTGAAPKRFWNYLRIKSGSVLRPGSSRSSTHGTRISATMCICTALFSAEGLQRMESSVNPPVNFLFR